MIARLWDSFLCNLVEGEGEDKSKGEGEGKGEGIGGDTGVKVGQGKAVGTHTRVAVGTHTRVGVGVGVMVGEGVEEVFKSVIGKRFATIKSDISILLSIFLPALSVMFNITATSWMYLSANT